MLLTRSLIEKYCTQKGLKNLHAFLLELLETGVFNFMDFLGEGENIQIPTVLPQHVLLHGSIKPIDTLEIPKVVNKDEASIYATDNPNYAIFLAIIDIQEGGNASVSIPSKKFSVSTGFVNGESKITNGYVCVVSKDTFTPTSNAEYISSNSVPVFFLIPVTPTDFTEEILVKNE